MALVLVCWCAVPGTRIRGFASIESSGEKALRSSLLLKDLHLSTVTKTSIILKPTLEILNQLKIGKQMTLKHETSK